MKRRKWGKNLDRVFGEHWMLEWWIRECRSVQFALSVFVCRDNGDGSRCLGFEKPKGILRGEHIRSVLFEMAVCVLTDHGHGSLSLFVPFPHCVRNMLWSPTVWKKEHPETAQRTREHNCFYCYWSDNVLVVLRNLKYETSIWFTYGTKGRKK